MASDMADTDAFGNIEEESSLQSDERESLSGASDDSGFTYRFKKHARQIAKILCGEIFASAMFIGLVCGIASRLAQKDALGALIIDAGSGLMIGSFLLWLIALVTLYTFSAVGGAHFNPAVTFFFWLFTSKVTSLDAVVHMLGQFVGSFVGYSIDMMIRPDLAHHPETVKVPIPNDPETSFTFYAMEGFLVALLCIVIFVVDIQFERKSGALKDEKKTMNRYMINKYIYHSARSAAYSFDLLVIASMFPILAVLGGDVSGGSFNFLRVVWPAAFDNDTFKIWGFVVAHIGGAVAAAVICWLLMWANFIGNAELFQKMYRAPKIPFIM